jgi:uncharacterized membrane protein YbhN (UPF0104 family)
LTRKTWVTVLRWLATAAAIAYIATLVDVDKVEAAAKRISAGAMIAAIVLVALNVVAGAARWRELLTAYGAQTRPSLARATRLYFVAFFYNNYLPGAVAGDVVRGVVARDAFGERGATASLAVVLVERALGLVGIFVLLAIGVMVAGSGLDIGNLWLWSALGLGGSVAIVLALPLARRLAPHLPGKLGEIAGRVPALASWPSFVTATLLSIATQALVALAGWVLLRAVEPRVDLGASLLIVPLAAATAFLPITVGGAGAREAVYVTLGASLFHMPKDDALAASLALWLAHLMCGAVGGVLQVADRSSRHV